MNTIDINQFAQDVVLRDGTTVHLRPIRPDDKQRLIDGFGRLSATSISSRFFGAKQALTAKELKYFTEVDFEHHVSFVVEENSKEGLKIIGAARYIELKEQGAERVAEVAFVVDDQHQNLGLGTLLFEQIVIIAQKKGISKLMAEVLRRNRNMLRIFERSGLKLKTDTTPDGIHIEFNIANQALNTYSNL